MFFLPVNGTPMQSLGWSLYYEMAFYAVFVTYNLIEKRITSFLRERLLKKALP